MGFIAARRAEKTAESEFDAFEVVAAQVVDVIATAGVVLDQSNNVVRASPGAIQFGLVQNRRLIHAALVNLAERAKAASGGSARGCAFRDRSSQRPGLRSRSRCPLWGALRHALSR